MKYQGIIMMALVALTVACQRENVELKEAGSGMPIALHTRTGGVENPVFSEGDKMGMYVTMAGEALKVSENQYSNTCLTFGEDVWTGGAMYYPNASNVDVYSYFPWQTTIADVHALSVNVAADQTVSGAYKKSDFLWAKMPDCAKSKEGLEVALKHRMSKAEIQLIPGSGVTEKYLQGATAVKLLNIKTTATADLATGEVSIADGAADMVVTTASAGECLWMAIVAPQTLAAGTNAIEITLEDGLKRVYKLDHDITYQAGKVKHFDITVSNESLSVSVVTIEDWTKDVNVVAGEAKIEISSPLVGGEDAIAGTSFSENAQLGMYFFSKNTLMVNGNNVLYTAAADGSVSSMTTLYYPAADAVDIYAYAPYKASATNSADYAFSIAADQTAPGAASASDLLLAKATGLKNGGAAAALTFGHAMSKVVVNLIKGNGITDTDLTSAQVVFCNTVLTAQVNLKDGSLSNLSGNASVTPIKDKDAYTAILLPQTLSNAQKFIEIRLGGMTWVYKSALTLKPKTRHTLNITVSNAGISVGVPVISGWEEEAPINAEGEKDPRGPIPSDDEAGIPPVSNNGVAVPDCSFASSAANEKICSVNVPGIKVNGEYVKLLGSGTTGQTVWLTVNNKEKGCYVVPKDDAEQEKLKLDIVFLVDNSSTMGDEANNVATGIQKWSDYLANQPNLDVKMGCVGYGYKNDMSNALSGALDLTSGDSFKSFFNRAGLSGVERTKGFVGDNAAYLEGKAKIISNELDSQGECCVMALKYSDRYLQKWRPGAIRIYVNFTDTGNQSECDKFNPDFSVSTIQKSFNGTVYTVYSSQSISSGNWKPEEAPWELSINTGAVLKDKVFEKGNGGVLFISNDAADLDLINNFDVTGVALNTQTVQFYAAEESEGIQNGKHTVKVTIRDKSGRQIGSRIYNNVTF